MSLPLVSIIIPCFNAERYVAEAIQSALDQTYENCEIIVIDDGSTDASLEVIKSFGDKIRWETGPNRGGCAARNRGFELSKGDAVKFLDADDHIHPEAVAMQMKTLRGRSDIAITCLLECFSNEPLKWNCNKNVKPVLTWAGKDFLLKRDIYKLQNISNASDNNTHRHSLLHCWLIPRPLIQKVGKWDEQLKVCQDSDFFSRIALHARKVILIPVVLAAYRVGVEGSTSSGVSRSHAESRLKYCYNRLEQLAHLDHEQDATTEIATIFVLQAIAFGPRFSDLQKIALNEVRKLEVKTTSLNLPPKTQLLARMVGLRLAITIVSFVRRYKVSGLFNIQLLSYLPFRMR